MKLMTVAILLSLGTLGVLQAQSGGYWSYSATNIWKYSAQPGRTDARWAQNITDASIDFTFENYSNATGKWTTDNEQFKWDMFDPNNLMVSILPRQPGASLQVGQKVRVTGTLTFAGQYYSSGSAKVNVGEAPIQTPYGWKSATELYPMWGYATDPVLSLSSGNNTTVSGSGDFATPKGPSSGTAKLTILCTTGIQGTAAVEYVYDWVAPVAPAISAVTQTTTGKPAIAPGAWFSVWGTNLASKTRPWTATDFSGQSLPTSLDGVQVLVHGKSALVSFISPTQINALAPTDTYTGNAEVQVVSASGAKSGAYTVSLAKLAPGFFLYQVTGTQYAIAHVGSEFIGKSGLVSGLTTRPVKPGETITLYGTGFGAASPAFAPETLVSGYAVLASQPPFSIGGVAATTLWAGQTGSGLYQFNVQVPEVADGDREIVATVGGASTPSGIAITVQR